MIALLRSPISHAVLACVFAIAAGCSHDRTAVSKSENDDSRPLNAAQTIGAGAVEQDELELQRFKGRGIVFEPSIGYWLATASDDDKVNVWDWSDNRNTIREFDGQTYAFASPPSIRLAAVDGGMVKVWDVESGQIIKEFMGHRFAFPAEGYWVATGSDQGNVTVWEVEREKELPKYNGQTFALSPYGYLLATANDDGKVTVWEVDDGTEYRTIVVNAAAKSLAFSREEHYLAMAGDDGQVRIWELQSGDEMPSVPGRSFAFSKDQDEQWLATISDDDMVTLWEVDSGKQILSIPAHSFAFCSNDDSNLLATGSANGKVTVWEVESNKEILTVDGETFAFSTGDNEDILLATAGNDGGVTLWNAQSGEEIQRLEVDQQPTNLALSPDNRWLATGSDDGKVTVWEVQSGKKIQSFAGRDFTFATLRRILLATTHKDGIVKVREVQNGDEKHRIPGHTLAVSADGRWLATATKDGRGTVTEVISGKVKLEFRGQAFKFSPDEPTLLAAFSGDGKVTIWDVQSGGEKQKFDVQATVKKFAFSPDNDYLATGHDDDHVTVWDLENGSQIHRFPGSDPVFEPFQGNLLATTRGDRVTLWDLNSGRETQNFPGKSPGFEPYGSFLATVHGEDRVTLWDLVSGNKVRSFPGRNFAITSDGLWLGTDCEDGTARLFNLEPLYEGLHNDTLAKKVAAYAASHEDDALAFLCAVYLRENLIVYETDGFEVEDKNIRVEEEKEKLLKPALAAFEAYMEEQGRKCPNAEYRVYVKLAKKIGRDFGKLVLDDVLANEPQRQVWYFGDRDLDDFGLGLMLLEYGIKNEQPLAIITAVNMLAKFSEETDEFQKWDEVIKRVFGGLEVEGTSADSRAVTDFEVKPNGIADHARETWVSMLIRTLQYASTLGKADQELWENLGRVALNFDVQREGVDWGGFLGPSGDGKSTETGILKHVENGIWNPTLRWYRDVGAGFGAPAVSDGHVYLFDRIGDQQRLRCRQSSTGNLVWEKSYRVQGEARGSYLGPRCSPVVREGRALDGPFISKHIFLYDEVGILSRVWERFEKGAGGVKGLQVTMDQLKNTLLDFGIPKNAHGVAATPVIHDDQLLVVAGTSDDDRSERAIVAFDNTGKKTLWNLGSYHADYSTPRVREIFGQGCGFALLHEGLMVFDARAAAKDEPVTKRLFGFLPWRPEERSAINAATPVVIEDTTRGSQTASDVNEAYYDSFVSTSHGKGSARVRWKFVKDFNDEVDMTQSSIVWQSKPGDETKGIEAQFATPIYVKRKSDNKGFLYGCNGRTAKDAELRCIDWDTGEVQWRHRGLARTSLLYVDQHFICLSEYGKLLLIEANPEKFEKVAEWTPPPTLSPAPGFLPRPLLSHPTWTAPVLSHGLLYIRAKDKLLCFDVMDPCDLWNRDEFIKRDELKTVKEKL